jgi:hypothetical protein
MQGLGERVGSEQAVSVRLLPPQSPILNSKLPPAEDVRLRIVATLARASDKPMSAWNRAVARLAVHPTASGTDANWDVQANGSPEVVAMVAEAATMVRCFFPRVRP